MSLHDHASFKPDWLPADPRISVRVPIRLPVFVIAPGGVGHSAEMTDVSTHGFRIVSSYRAALGRFLTIDVPAFARYTGWVAWAHESEFGFDVTHPMPGAVVEHLQTLARKS